MQGKVDFLAQKEKGRKILQPLHQKLLQLFSFLMSVRLTPSAQWIGEHEK